jgi:ABC-type transport system involved in Fe-S cluster assembly fused permease/ATPase subunit
MNADAIVVLKRVRDCRVAVSETGTHGELLKKRGTYAVLWDNYTGKSKVDCNLGRH